MVRVLEIPELVAGVEIKPSGNLGLQGNDLVEFSEVGTFVDDVMFILQQDGSEKHIFMIDETKIVKFVLLFCVFKYF